MGITVSRSSGTNARWTSTVTQTPTVSMTLPLATSAADAAMDTREMGEHVRSSREVSFHNHDLLKSCKMT